MKISNLVSYTVHVFSSLESPITILNHNLKEGHFRRSQSDKNVFQ